MTESIFLQVLYGRFSHGTFPLLLDIRLLSCLSIPFSTILIWRSDWQCRSMFLTLIPCEENEGGHCPRALGIPGIFYLWILQSSESLRRYPSSTGTTHTGKDENKNSIPSTKLKTTQKKNLIMDTTTRRIGMIKQECTASSKLQHNNLEQRYRLGMIVVVVIILITDDRGP